MEEDWKEMSTDEMEAKSCRFGGGALNILPLKSGQWAIFRDQDLLKIVDRLDEDFLRGQSKIGQEGYASRRAAERQKKTFSLEDIGLV